MAKCVAISFSEFRFSWKVNLSLFTTVCGLLIITGSAQGVPAAPNESWVVGEVVETATVDSLTLNIQPQQNLFPEYKLRIVTVEAIPGADNGLRGYEGKTIEALARDALGSGDVKGKIVKARVAFEATNAAGGTGSWKHRFCAGQVRGKIETTGLLETCNADWCGRHLLDSLP